MALAISLASTAPTLAINLTYARLLDCLPSLRANKGVEGSTLFNTSFAGYATKSILRVCWWKGYSCGTPCNSSKIPFLVDSS